MTKEDCISRQVVAKFLDDWLFCLDENCHKQSASDLKMIIKDFKNLPSIQPDIIHCKDCAYCDSDVVDSPYGMTNKVWWCDRLYAGANENLIVEPDDFCSWAERRE